MGSSSLGVLAATKEEPEHYNRIIGVDGSFVLNDNDIVDFQIASGQTEMELKRNIAYNVNYLRTGDLLGFNLNFDRVEPAFEINRIGYIQKETDRGWNKFAGLFKFSPRINKHQIRRIIANMNYEHNRDLFTSHYINRWLNIYPGFVPDPMFGAVAETITGERFIGDGAREENNFKLATDVTINLMNEMSVTAEYKHYTATELTGNYTGNYFKMGYATKPLRLGTQLAGLFSVAGGTLYNFNKKYIGSQKSISADIDGRLSNNVLTTLQGGYTKTFDFNDKQDGRYYKLSSNTTWMFTKDFYVRVHAQGIFGATFYNQEQISNEYLLSGLLSWEYRPGSFLFLAYNEDRYDDSNPTRSSYMVFNNRTLVLKLSYFFSA